MQKRVPPIINKTIFNRRLSRKLVFLRSLAPLIGSFLLALISNGHAQCVPAPSGLVSWWRGESNAFDQLGTNNGTLVGNITFGPGKVGQGFVIDGNGSAVLVGNPPGLQLQNFTIEAWVKRGSASIVSHNSGDGEIFSYGSGGYAFGMDDTGLLFLSKADIDGVKV